VKLVVAVLAVAGVLALLACSGSVKRETALLVAAVDRYERADDASKGTQLQAVAAVACSAAQVCDAKRACLAAMDPTAQALALKEEVAARIEDLQNKRLSQDSPEAQALPGKLDLAAKLLKEGRAKMPACERKLADLRIASGV
jgi:hypothetical protein